MIAISSLTQHQVPDDYGRHSNDSPANALDVLDHVCLKMRAGGADHAGDQEETRAAADQGRDKKAREREAKWGRKVASGK